MQAKDIPVGWCQCGCGRKTGIASGTETRKGRTKGKPLQYIYGHGNRRQLAWTVEDHGYETPCWVAEGRRNQSGYGRNIWLDGKCYAAHRYAWVRANGPIPDGLFVLHRCDNPPCVNPGHLFLGTHADNMADMVAKGRQAFHGHSSLREPDVREIRRLVAGGVRQAKVAEMFGVARQTVGRIVLRQRWGHVD